MDAGWRDIASRAAISIATIGGGIEADETERQAGVRELWEETGIRADPAALLGPVGAETVEFSWPPYVIEQHQTYYLLDVQDTAVSFAHLEEVEIATTLSHRWWSLDDLRTTGEHVLDNQLAILEDSLGARYRRAGS